MRVSLYILVALVVLIVAAITRMPASIASDQILHRLNLPGDVTILHQRNHLEGQTQLNFRTFQWRFAGTLTHFALLCSKGSG